MGSHQFQIPDSMAREWIEDTREGKQIFQFELVQISQRELKQDYRLLIQRSTYIIPKTPKIMLLKKLKGQTCILVQRCDESLSKYISKIAVLSDLLHLLKEITQAVRCLCKKYGAFRLTARMLGVTRNKQILVWMNERSYKTEVQYPLQNGNQIEQEMISVVIRMVREHSCFPLKHYILENPPLHFQSFINGLNELARSLRTVRSPPHKRQKVAKVGNVLSPQSFRLQKSRQINVLAPEAKRETVFSKRACKTGRVPSFIKAITKNKAHMLNSLRHITAVSIDQSKFLKDEKAVSPENHQFKSADKIKSTNEREAVKPGYEVGSCQMERQYKSNSKGETQHLTASQISNSFLVKRNAGFDVETFRVYVKEMQQTKQQTIRQFHQSTTGMSSYFKKDESSLLFVSENKLPQTLKQGNPLVSLCPNMCESKYFDRKSKIEEVVSEQQLRRSNAKMIEEQLGEIFSNRSKSPRNYFQFPDNTDLLQEFGKVMNFL